MEVLMVVVARDVLLAGCGVVLAVALVHTRAYGAAPLGLALCSATALSLARGHRR